MDKPHYINPLAQVIIERLQAAFLKSGSTSEFYELLEVPKNANAEKIRSQYRKKALQYHPDKIQQKYHRPATDDEKAMNLKIKEAYTVLSDQKKRKLYNQLGSGGYRFIESPEQLATSEGQKTLIENFQKNNRDKVIALTIIFLIIALFVLQPILICLRIDGDIDTAWTSIWFPLWIFDCFMLIDGLGSLCMPSDTEPDEDGKVPDPITLSDRLEAAYMLFLYILFVAFQALLTLQLDGSIDVNWYTVFTPWLVWEVGRITWLIKSSCLTTVPYPDLLHANHAPAEGAGDEEDGEGFNPEINNQVNLEKLTRYYASLVVQDQQKRTITTCFLRFWLALFLAAKLNGSVNWDWGLVFLPVWLFLLFENCFACYFQVLGTAMSEGIDPVELQNNPNVEDHAKMFYSTNMSGSCAQICCSQLCLILFYVLLVVALQGTGIPSFVIILPFWPLALLILVLFFCFFCAVGCLDTDQLDVEGAEGGEDGGATDSSDLFNSSASTAAAASAAAQSKEGTYVPPDPAIPTVFVPPAAPEEDPDRSSNSNTSPLVATNMPEPPVTSRASEID